MRKNLKKYCQAWILFQQGKKLKDIAQIMNLKSKEWPRCMISYINFRIKNKFIPLPHYLKRLASKYIISKK